MINNEEDLPVLDFKQGATFSLTGTVLLPAGTWTAASEIRNGRGDLVCTPLVALTPLGSPTATASHTVVIATVDDTGSWAGVLRTDVFFTDSGGVKVPSETYLINVKVRETGRG